MQKLQGKILIRMNRNTEIENFNKDLIKNLFRKNLETSIKHQNTKKKRQQRMTWQGEMKMFCNSNLKVIEKR